MGQYAIARGWQEPTRKEDGTLNDSLLADQFCRQCEYWIDEGVKGCDFCRNPRNGKLCSRVRMEHIYSRRKPNSVCPSPYLVEYEKDDKDIGEGVPHDTTGSKRLGRISTTGSG